MLGTTIFFAGSCGMMILFRRWRQQGDRLAKILCVTAFGRNFPDHRFEPTGGYGFNPRLGPGRGQGPQS